MDTHSQIQKLANHSKVEKSQNKSCQIFPIYSTATLSIDGI